MTDRLTTSIIPILRITGSIHLDNRLFYLFSFVFIIRLMGYFNQVSLEISEIVELKPRLLVKQGDLRLFFLF
jgi:hypothetical protein